MLKVISILILILINDNICFAQNLVPNFSFEETPCSGTAEELQYIFTTPYWFSPNGKTVDSYHTCKDPIEGYVWLRPPYAPFGYQQPSDGNGYAGIRTFLDFTAPNSPGAVNYREYLAVKLIKPLDSGRIYTVSFKYSLGEKADFTTDDLGIYISKDSIPNVDVLNFVPQIRNPEGNILTNTTTWETIGGTYTASGGEEYIVIGNFNDDAHTTMVRTSQTYRIYTSYFYIDEVMVESCNNVLSQLNLGDDLIVCQGEKVLLDATLDNTSYLWQDGSTNPTFEVKAPGLYWVQVTSPTGCSIRDSIVVSYNPLPIVNLGEDTFICQQDSLLLDVTTTNATYLWQDGSTNSSFKVSSEGLYWVRVEANNCSFTDSIYVRKGGCEFFIPNVITPNNDGVNDYFVIKTDESTEENNWLVEIYNRWGKQVYRSPYYKDEWNAKNLQNGVYFYLIRNNKSKHTYKGTLTVFR